MRKLFPFGGDSFHRFISGRPPVWIVALVLGLALQPARSAAQDGEGTAPRPDLSARAQSDLQPLSARYAAAVEAFRAARGQRAHYLAAREAAAIRYSQGRVLEAQWWLRRAANYAPNRFEADRNRADFRAIRGEARFRPSLSFSIRPSSNINNGVDDRVFSLGDILLVFPSSALALSGVEYTVQAELEYRVSRSERHQTFVDASFYLRTYSLSEEAKRTAPTVRGSDYEVAQLAFGLTHVAQLIPAWGATRARLSAGQVWSGRAELRWFTRLDLTQNLPVPDPHRAAATAYVERQYPLQSGQPDAMVWGLRMSYLHLLSSRDAVALSLETQLYDASIDTYTYRSNHLRLSYRFSQPILTLGVTLHAGLSNKTYDEFSLSLDGRRDYRAEVGATAVFNELTAFGFSPSVTVTAHRNWSNVDRFDTRGISVELGFQSRF